MNRQLTSQIINAAIEVHRQLGPGLLESVYLRCLQIELEGRSIYVQTELQLPVVYKGQIIQDLGFRMDMLVEGQVVVELKSVQRIEPVHKKQLLSYLRLSGKEIGLSALKLDFRSEYGILFRLEEKNHEYYKRY